MKPINKHLVALWLVTSIAQQSVAQRTSTDSGSVVTGIVMTADGRSVADADVTLLGLGAIRTDSLGRFSFRGVPAGTVLIRVQRLGLNPILQAIELDGVHPRYVVLTFGGTPALVPIVVRDSAVTAREPTGFERRRRTGHGIYLTEQEIEQRHAARVEHLLGQLPGVQVDTSGIVRTDRGRTSLFTDNCQDGMQVFLDGVAVSPDFSLRSISPSSIRAIEVYRGVASTPVELRSSRAVCGTLVIWTK